MQIQKFLLVAGVTFLALYLTASFAPSKLSSSENFAAEINNMQSSWKATSNSPFPNYSISQLRSMFNLQVEKTLPSNFDKAPIISVDALPDSFDPREKWADCSSLKDVRDQSACGSCWAFGAAEAMTDRLCIGSGQKDQRRLAATELLECCHTCGMGCNGGFLYQSWSFWKSSGIPTGGLFDDKNSCKPYPFAPCNHHSEGPFDDCSKHHYSTPSCHRACTNPDYKVEYKDDKSFAKSAYDVSGEENIKKELFENGPLEVAFTVYEDFLLYKSGVYHNVKGSALGGHAVKLMGWGVENGENYWLVVNSWNTNWGDKGMFKIRRGHNDCGIESSVVGGLPK